MPTISFSGIASGIDTDAIIKAINDNKKLATIPLQRQVASNEDQSKALEDLNTKLLTLNDSVKGFLTLSGGVVSRRATSSNEDAVEASASSNATISGTTVTVQQLARTATLSFNDKFSSADTAIAPGLSDTGKLEFSIGSGDKQKTFSVDVTSKTTLNDIVSAISAQAPGTLQAAAVNVGTDATPQYILLVNGLTSGESEGALSVNVSSEITGQNVFTTSTLEQAKDAIFTVSGIGEVRRPSNQITGLLPGLTLRLKQENAGPVQIGIANDADKTAANVETFVTALNEMIKYAKDNDKIERVESGSNATNVFGTLARTNIDNSLIASLREAISGSSATSGDKGVRVFPDLGLTIERDGTYKFDKTKFMESVAKDPEAANQIISGFADRVGSTTGVIAQYTRYQGFIDNGVQANDEENDSINKRLEQIQTNMDKQTEGLKKLFANLESTIGKLNSSGQALTSMLAGLNR